MAGHYARSLSFTRNWSLNLCADLADPAIAVGPRNTTDDDPTIKFFEADLAQAWALPHDDDIHESKGVHKRGFSLGSSSDASDFQQTVFDLQAPPAASYPTAVPAGHRLTPQPTPPTLREVIETQGGCGQSTNLTAARHRTQPKPETRTRDEIFEREVHELIRAIKSDNEIAEKSSSSRKKRRRGSGVGAKSRKTPKQAQAQSAAAAQKQQGEPPESERRGEPSSAATGVPTALEMLNAAYIRSLSIGSRDLMALERTHSNPATVRKADRQKAWGATAKKIAEALPVSHVHAASVFTSALSSQMYADMELLVQRSRAVIENRMLKSKLETLTEISGEQATSQAGGSAQKAASKCISKRRVLSDRKNI
mmetsp:Transcript_2835/g.9755  ORF Transcript_2835/g.9755 Transcript_2835/m.9755 type:complete len:367 (-) Transcript_2835:170-1270(-)